MFHINLWKFPIFSLFQWNFRISRLGVSFIKIYGVEVAKQPLHMFEAMGPWFVSSILVLIVPVLLSIKYRTYERTGTPYCAISAFNDYLVKCLDVCH